jgi:hypothetical protein
MKIELYKRRVVAIKKSEKNSSRIIFEGRLLLLIILIDLYCLIDFELSCLLSQRILYFIRDIKVEIIILSKF